MDCLKSERFYEIKLVFIQGQHEGQEHSATPDNSSHLRWLIFLTAETQLLILRMILTTHDKTYLWAMEWQVHDNSKNKDITE